MGRADGPARVRPCPWDRPARRSGEDGACAGGWHGGSDPGSSGPMRLARWVGSSGPCSHLARSSTPAAGLVGQRGLAALPAGSGCGGMSSVGGVFSVRWGGGEAAVGVAGQPPPALMHRPVVGSADQGQIRPGRWGRHGANVGDGGLRTRPGVAWQPVMAQPPSRTTRAARWAAVTTRVVRPTSSGWVGPPPRAGGSRLAAAWSQAAKPPSSPWSPWPVAGWSGRSGPGSWWSWWWVVVRWRVTRTRVTAPSQASRRHASGSSGRSRANLATEGAGVAERGCPGRPSPAAGAASHPIGGAGRAPGCGGPAR